MAETSRSHIENEHGFITPQGTMLWETGLLIHIIYTNRHKCCLLRCFCQQSMSFCHKMAKSQYRQKQFNLSNTWFGEYVFSIETLYSFMIVTFSVAHVANYSLLTKPLVLLSLYYSSMCCWHVYIRINKSFPMNVYCYITLQWPALYIHVCWN